MRIRIFPYKSGSASAKALRRSLGALRLKQQGSRFRPRASDWIINWGSTTPPQHDRTLNHGWAVERASNKLSFFECIDLYNSQVREDDDSIKLPPFTTDRSVAASWIADGKKVVCRTLTRANSGRGIVIAETEDQLVSAPLYTQYVPKTQEYRLHVFMGEVFDVQRKMRSSAVADEDVNWQVRSHTNGFVFGREGVDVPDHVKHMAIRTIQTLGLSFGAVDMIYNERRDTYYVLEVNTAPGLTGTTLDKYVEVFNGYLHNM